MIQPKVGDNDGKHDLVPLSRPITMRDVFTHTSGVSYSIMTNLSNGAINLAQKLYEQSGVMQAGTLEEMIDIVATLPLVHQPGASWNCELFRLKCLVFRV